MWFLPGQGGYDLLGVILQFIGLLMKVWIWILIATVFFGVALVLRVGAGIAHKIEKYYMDKLRFGRWRKNK